MYLLGKKSLSRRHFLRGAGYALGLPLLDAMIPAMSRAQSLLPLRVAYLYFPHGTNSESYSWKANTSGTNFTFPRGLANSRLVSHRPDLLVLGGLFNEWSQYNIYGDDNNDHAAASSSFLTAARANRRAAKSSLTLSRENMNRGPFPFDPSIRSVDVAIASHIGKGTALPVLHLTPPGFARDDAGTSEYSSDYRTFISWQNADTPTPRFENPRSVFRALFESGGANSMETSGSQDSGLKKRRSLLDYVLQEAKSLNVQLGATDRIKMEEYLSSVRAVELSLDKMEQGEDPMPLQCSPGSEPSSGMSFPEMTKAYLDLIVLAFQCDRTRVATHMLDFEFSGRSYSFAGANRYDCHQASHGNFSGDYGDAYRIIDWYSNQFAYLIEKMKNTQDAGGSLLSQSLLHLGSGTNTTGGDHPDHDLPFVIAGQGHGLLATGRALDANDARLANYHLTLMKKLGMNIDSFGNSNGTISGI